MIAFLEGKVKFTENNGIVLLNNGVGYLVNLPKYELDKIILDSDIGLFIYSHIKEDAIDLYGFFSLEEKHMFQMLISISGIGPKIALSILSYLRLDSLIEAIIEKNIAILSTVPGIGKKSAERISLELKDKVLKIRPIISTRQVENSVVISLQSAIKSLGYNTSQSEFAINKINKDELNSLPLDILIRKALNVLTGVSNEHN